VRPAERSTSGAFPEEGPSNGQVSILKRNNVKRERVERIEEKEREISPF